MRVSTSITTLTLSAVLVIASPIGSRHPPARGRARCLHPTDAQKIVSKYIAILSHTASDLGDANATAQALLDDNFQEISDSILSLKGLPLDAVTFPSKQAYIEGVLSEPAATNIGTIEVLVAGCSNVLWYWNMQGVGTMAHEVKGFSLFNITSAMQISTTYLEFNNVAWGLDTGFNLTRSGS